MHLRSASLLFILCCIAPGAGLPACAQLVSALPAVIAAVTDASQIIDAIEDFAKRFFAAKPDPEREEVVLEAVAKTRTALNVALRFAQGAESLDQAKVDQAFADFRVAYQSLLTLTAPLGVREAGALAAGPGMLTVPKPMALTLKVEL
jgi:hypothetical protein